MNKGHRIEVLDHGYVAYIDSVGDDNSALIAARMSTDNPTGVDAKKDDSLRARLWEDQHTSPFEMPDLTVEIQAPLFVLRQIDRHRTVDYTEGFIAETTEEISRQYMSRNEFSGRYSVMPDLFYIPTPDRVLGKDPANKQGSLIPLDRIIQNNFVDEVKEVVRLASSAYEWAIEHGVASELARIVLPLNQYTKIQLKGSMLSWLKFLRLRLPEDVQWETRQYAEAIATIVKGLWPKTWDVFEQNTLSARTLNAQEITVMKQLLEEAVRTERTLGLEEFLGPAKLKKLFKKLGVNDGGSR